MFSLQSNILKRPFQNLWISFLAVNTKNNVKYNVSWIFCYRNKKISFDFVRKRCQEKSCFENYLAKQQKEFVISPTDAIVHPWAMMIHPLEVDFG